MSEEKLNQIDEIKKQFDARDKYIEEAREVLDKLFIGLTFDVQIPYRKIHKMVECLASHTDIELTEDLHHSTPSIKCIIDRLLIGIISSFDSNDERGSEIINVCNLLNKHLFPETILESMKYDHYVKFDRDKSPYLGTVRCAHVLTDEFIRDQSERNIKLKVFDHIEANSKEESSAYTDLFSDFK